MSAISDTGPLISIFQSDSLDTVIDLVDQLYISPTCENELKKHGYAEALMNVGSSIIVYKLTVNEAQKAWILAQQIADAPRSKDSDPRSHLGEAETIILASRAEFQDELLLIDERIARAVAKKSGLQVVGFAGLLLSAVEVGLLKAEEVKSRLLMCRQQGTHYGEDFIEGIYESAQEIERERLL